MPYFNAPLDSELAMSSGCSAAGDLLDLDQPNVSALVNEKISRFSVEKLMTFVSRLGFGVSVRIKGAGVTLDMPVTSGALEGNWGNESSPVTIIPETVHRKTAGQKGFVESTWDTGACDGNSYHGNSRIIEGW